jgi:hypothetical protein
MVPVHLLTMVSYCVIHVLWNFVFPAVLNFMYHGEVNLAQEDLNSFLCVSGCVKLYVPRGGESGSGGSQLIPSGGRRSQGQRQANPQFYVPLISVVIRIRSDPELFAGSGSGINNFGSGCTTLPLILVADSYHG